MRKPIMTLMVTTALLLPAGAALAAYGANYLDRGEIKQVQQVLSDSGYYRAEVDGIWGQQSKAALKSFQANNGLPVTGQLDQMTLDELGVQVSAADDMHYGMQGSRMHSMHDSEMAGYETRDDRSWIERLFGMDGEDSYSQDEEGYRLSREVAPASGDAHVMYYEETRTMRPTQTRYLDEKSTQALQQALRDAGYLKSGNVDGQWDIRTVTALSSYQMNEGLPASGVPDQETLTHLGLQIPAAEQVPDTEKN